MTANGLLEALEQLSSAHGPKALAEGFARLQGQIKRARRQSERSLGTLAQTYQEAMRIWQAQKAEGMSEKDRIAHLAKTLKASWPKPRGPIYQRCTGCDDYGLRLKDCRGSDCGRRVAHDPHTYGEPCDCPKGARFKERPRSEGDFTQAGKTKGFSRVGR